MYTYVVELTPDLGMLSENIIRAIKMVVYNHFTGVTTRGTKILPPVPAES